MKSKFVLLFTLMPIFCFSQNKHIVIANTIPDLKAKPLADSAIYYVLGKTVMSDNGGGFVFMYSSTAVDAEETTYNNVLKPNSVTTGPGRFIRLNTRNISVPQGIVEMNGGIKTLTATGVVNSSGEVVVNLTWDNTTNGGSIFTQTPMSVICSAQPSGATSNDVIVGQGKAFSNSDKQLTCAFSRGSSSLLSLSIVTSGLTILGFRPAATGTPVTVTVKGL